MRLLKKTWRLRARAQCQTKGLTQWTVTVTFLQTDGAHPQDKKADISAQNKKIIVDNPRPDRFESEKWAKVKSLPDYAVMVCIATEEVK